MIRHLKPTRQHVLVQLSNGERNKCDTWDRPLDVRDDNCAIVLTTLCVSVIDVYIENKTHTHKVASMT